MFQNVKAMSLPTSLDGLVVEVADAAAAERITRETGLLPDKETIFFELRTANRVGYVVASVVVADEDQGEYFEPSTYWPGPEGNPA